MKKSLTSAADGELEKNDMRTLEKILQPLTVTVARKKLSRALASPSAAVMLAAFLAAPLTVSVSAQTGYSPKTEDIQLPASYFERGNSAADGEPQSAPLPDLLVSRYSHVPFRVQFKAANRLPDGSLQFQLNLLDVSRQKTRFVKTGDEIEGYKIGEYREKIAEEERDGVKRAVNRSELDLIHVKLNETTALVLNTQTELDESRVTFKVSEPGAKLAPDNVKRGDTFKLVYLQDSRPAEVEFQLLECGAAGAVVRNIKTGGKTHVKSLAADGELGKK